MGTDKESRMSKLHEKYTVSASIHAICKEYEITKKEIAKRIGCSVSVVYGWVNCSEPMGERNYNSLVETFPKFKGKIQYS